jgi:hypothetical protein
MNSLMSVAWSVPYSGSSGGYTDYSAVGIITYYYRAAAISGGQVVVYSNSVAMNPP